MGGEAGDVDGGLGDVRLVQSLLGALEAEFRQRDAEDFVGPIEQRAVGRAVRHAHGRPLRERDVVRQPVYAALVDEIVRAKPAAAKGRYIRGITLTSTMGPGIKIDTAEAGVA